MRGKLKETHIIPNTAQYRLIFTDENSMKESRG